MPEKTKKIFFQIRLPEELMSGVKSKANELGISQNSVIALAVDNYIKSYRAQEVK